MQHINCLQAGDRLFECGQDDFRLDCINVAESVAPFCESNIEVMLLSALVITDKLCVAKGKRLLKIVQREDVDCSDAYVVIFPQYQWEKYRIDFCLNVVDRDYRFFVECDGHDFHERTKEQAERDRSKDRAIQLAGISILRFTGREIYRNPFDCSNQILKFMTGRLPEKS